MKNLVLEIQIDWNSSLENKMDGKSSSEKSKLIENVVNGIPFDVILSVYMYLNDALHCHYTYFNIRWWMLTDDGR